jgi:hypothetical protein
LRSSFNGNKLCFPGGVVAPQPGNVYDKTVVLDLSTDGFNIHCTWGRIEQGCVYYGLLRTGIIVVIIATGRESEQQKGEKQYLQFHAFFISKIEVFPRIGRVISVESNIFNYG